MYKMTSTQRYFSTKRRVVVTGLGVVSPLGCGWKHVWKQLINGQTGIQTITRADIMKLDLPSKIAATIPIGNEQYQYNIDRYVPKTLQQSTSPFIHYAIASSTLALQDANIDTSIMNEEQKQRIGVCIGSGIGSVEDGSDAGTLLSTKGRKGVSVYTIPKMLVNLAAGQVSILYDIRGPNHAVSTACTTGAHAIGDAYRFIQYNDADIMIAGGTDACVTPIPMSLFARCRTLSSKFNDTPHIASRPFDSERDGFVMGEGSAVIILEEYEHAKKRNATIYAEISGYGLSSDAYHITSPSPDGRGAIACMKSALKHSNLLPDDIDYLNAHATSTIIGDAVENHAMITIFGVSSNLSVSSTKGAVGHMLGAAGSIEAIFTILSLHTQICPISLNILNLLPEFNLDYLRTSKQKQVNAAMSNSFKISIFIIHIHI
jgi:3-oxoacyl-[acyl-carrier-protein] synthase II